MHTPHTPSLGLAFYGCYESRHQGQVFFVTILSRNHQFPELIRQNIVKESCIVHQYNLDNEILRRICIKKGDRGGKKNYVFVPRTLTVLAFDLG